MGKKRKAFALNWQYVGLGALAVVTAGVVAFSLTNNPAPEAIATASFAPKPLASTAAPQVIRFAAVGDSITEGDSPNIEAGDVGPGSWVSHAAGDGLTFVGGWADGGARSETMASNAKSVKADVLVVLAGTNDVGNGVPFEESAANIASIVKTVGAKRVIVSAIPPSSNIPDEARAYNTELRAFVKKNKWTWVDSTAKIRTKANTYVDGLTTDGVHPTQAAAQMIGESIRAAILAK